MIQKEKSERSFNNFLRLLHLFEIILNCLIQLLMERLGKLLLGLGGDLLGAAVNHAFCHSVHQIASLHEKIIEALAAALLVLPLRLCPLVIFISIWSGTTLRRKCGLYPGKTVGAVLALKILQNLKQFTKHGCFLLLIIFEYTLSSVEATIRVYLKSYLDLIIIGNLVHANYGRFNLESFDNDFYIRAQSTHFRLVA